MAFLDSGLGRRMTAHFHGWFVGRTLRFRPATGKGYVATNAGLPSGRVNSLLKERYGGRWVRVRGAAKVMCHLMFGLVALTATVLFARLC
jgi:hypothetical protein